MNQGFLLGLPIDPIGKKVEIYRQDKDKEILSNLASRSGENVLPDFNLDLKLASPKIELALNINREH